MRFVATVFLFIALLSVCLPALALDRIPGEEELDRIERIRQMIDDMGYSWQAGPTSVSHLSEEEFENLLGVRIPPDFEERVARAREMGRMVETPEGMYFPSVFDWRTEGGVTPVVDQGSCGSCWAFCAAAALESQLLIYSGVTENVSEQAVVSCNTEGDGCGGGWMDTAYDMWISHGAVGEACMPYHEDDTDPCAQAGCDIIATIDDYYYVDDNVDAIKTAVLDGPVAVAVAVCGGFNSYTGGCYEENCTEINHGVTIVGWDDTMCGDGAWIVKNSWGPDWGDDGFIYMKYGTCYIGYGAAAIDYSPDQTVHFFHDSHAIDDSAGDGDGNIETGEVIVLPVTLLNIGAETATNVSAHLESLTPGVSVLDNVAGYADIPKGETRESDSPHFSFAVTPAGPSCGQISLHFTVSSDQGTSHINLAIQAGEIITVLGDDFESDQGWTVGAPDDDATTGIWERGDPDGTYWGTHPVQPEDDNTPSPGSTCYVTATPGGTSIGTYDVDGGKTTLTSPVVDLSDKDSALLTYYRWYASETGSNPNDDDFLTYVSNDGGATWVHLDSLTYSAREWTMMEFFLEDYVALTGQMKVRFVAQDNGAGGSIVEAAVDDVTILTCSESVTDIEPPVVAVLNPNGGELCQCGSSFDVQWTATDNVGIISVSIFLSTDGGSTFPDTVAIGEPNDGQFTWFLPQVDSDKARIKVVAMDPSFNEGDDMSDEDFTLWGSLSGVEPDASPDIPRELILNVINSGMARIVFGLPSSSQVNLDVYDVSGRLVETLVSGRRAEGYHTIDWNGEGVSGSPVSPGVYFVRLDSDGGRKTAKVILAR